MDEAEPCGSARWSGAQRQRACGGRCLSGPAHQHCPARCCVASVLTPGP